MKIIYMGTPEFAVAPLRKLYESGYEIPIVVTQPDKARDRGKKVQFTPVKELALEKNSEVLQPEKIKNNEEILEIIKGAKPDLIVVAAYGKILPKELLEIPRLGCINIHASLLPKYRGAAPIHRSIIEGEEETGITLMYMAEGLDTGDMISSVSTPIDKKTVSQLHEELSNMGAKLLIDTLPDIEKGKNQRISQDDSIATYAPMVFKKDGEIDFSKTPEEIERLIRGLNSWPGAHTVYQGEPMKVWESLALEETTEKPDGMILEIADKGFKVSAGGRKLLITKIQMPGKKSMEVSEYLKGNKIQIGEVLG